MQGSHNLCHTLNPHHYFANRHLNNLSQYTLTVRQQPVQARQSGGREKGM
jgi:hypothetical protein